MGKLCLNNHVLWWSLFYISSFALLGNGGAGKLVMKGRPYFKEEAIIKTFEFDGDVIDCVDIYKQPAFDHPLLKNHTIKGIYPTSFAGLLGEACAAKMKPTHTPERSTEYSEVNGSAVEDTHPWLFTKGCPEGSIPITRMPYMNGLFGNNASASDSHIPYPRYLHEHGGTKGKKDDDPTLHEYAFAKFTADKLYGACADFSVYRPNLEGANEFSLAQIWVASNDVTTTLEAGWMVYPRLYVDYRTRFFTLWTNNGYETFCYNLQCPGFVWTNHNIRLDTTLEPVSVYEGQQYDVKIEIFQDVNNGDWWLMIQRQSLGYWPKSLVPKLEDGAQIHNLGGEILNTKLSRHHTSTQMGSGHFAVEGYKKAAYIRNVQIVEAHDRTKYISLDHGSSVITHPNCYSLHPGNAQDLQWGFHFYFGGPGRSATCT